MKRREVVELDPHQVWFALKKNWELNGSARGFGRIGPLAYEVHLTTFPDLTLRAASLSAIKNILMPIPRTPFCDEEDDCDDKAGKAFCAVKTQPAFRRVAFGKCILDRTYDGVVRHAMNLAIVLQGERSSAYPVLIEPQRIGSGKVFSGWVRWPRPGDRLSWYSFF
jgi:hypothetical protein